MRCGQIGPSATLLKMNSKTTCPKCGYKRSPEDSHIHEGLCPACGIAYKKWQSNQSQDNEDEATEATHFTVQPSRTLSYKLWQIFTYVPEQTDVLSFWGRVCLLVLFALWGAYFIFSGVDWEAIGGSFLHSINLPFHEFGHVLFSPFGRFMAVLGGSLFQVMMPLIALLSFSLQMKDNFAAAIMLWWAGQNMIDVSPYIADAKYRSIPLIRGLGEDYHDWGNLLSMLDMVDSAHTIANSVFICGAITIIFALFWAGWILNKQKANLAP